MRCTHLFINDVLSRDSEIPGSYDPATTAAECVDTARCAATRADRVFVMKLGRYDVIGQWLFARPTNRTHSHVLYYNILYYEYAVCIYVYGVLFVCLSKRICSVTFFFRKIRFQSSIIIDDDDGCFCISETYSPIIFWWLNGLLFNFYYFGFRSIVN